MGVIRDTLHGVPSPSDIVGVRRHPDGDPEYQSTPGLLLRAVLRDVANLLAIDAPRFDPIELPSGSSPPPFHAPVTLDAELPNLGT